MNFAVDQEGQQFRSVMWARNSRDKLRADITFRVSIAWETEMKNNNNEFTPFVKYDTMNTLDQKIPSCRMLPFYVVAFMEVQRKTVDSLVANEILHQPINYCISLLKASPDRKYAFAVITNFVNAVFVFVERNNPSSSNLSEQFNAACSKEIPHENIADNLAVFSCMSPEELGWCSFSIFNEPEKHKWTPRRLLGRGSTCYAVSGQIDNTDCVVKICSLARQLTAERTILSYLNSSICKTKCKGREIWPSVNDTLQCLVRKHYVTVLTAEYQKVSPQKITPVFMAEVAELLQILHSCNVLHRDIRIPNIATQGQSYVLMDFSASCWIKDTLYSGQWYLFRTATKMETIYPGKPAILTASTKYLQDVDYKLQPQDEAESLVHLYLVHKYKVGVYGGDKSEFIVKSRANFWKHRCNFYKTANKNSQESIKLAEDIENTAKTAKSMYDLFLEGSPPCSNNKIWQNIYPMSWYTLACEIVKSCDRLWVLEQRYEKLRHNVQVKVPGLK